MTRIFFFFFYINYKYFSKVKTLEKLKKPGKCQFFWKGYTKFFQVSFYLENKLRFLNTQEHGYKKFIQIKKNFWNVRNNQIEIKHKLYMTCIMTKN